MPSPSSARLATKLAAMLAAGVVGAAAAAGPIVVDLDQPTLDRWMYPFNPAPGVRPTSPTFGVFNDPRFDDRDSQFHIGFDTDAFVQTGEGAERYQISAASVRVTVLEGGAFRYDPSYDSWRTYLPTNDPEYVADADVGRPVEMFGVGYRNGFTAATFLENSPHGAPIGKGQRNAYPTDYPAGQPDDVSNTVTFGFDAAPFAIGANSALTSGQLVPANTHLTFEIDLNNADALAYLRAGLNEGRLRFAVTSLHGAEDPGHGDEFDRGVTVNYPIFYTRENKFGSLFAARLHLEVTIADPSIPGDVNGDGVVDFTDFSIVLTEYGLTGAGLQGDVNGDGAVDFTDFSIVLANYGAGAP